LHSPVLNDSTYGNPGAQLKKLGPDFEKILQDYPHPLLHAKILGMGHPITKNNLRFEVPPPPVFTEVLNLAKTLLKK
ncbi:MAG: RNA pseudouridine synthase, partial [Pseudomonadota bacterium]